MNDVSKFLIGVLISFFIAAVIGDVVLLIDRNYSIQKYEKLDSQFDQYRNIEKISKTVRLAYNLSKWESDVYAYMTTRFNYDWTNYIAMLRIESNFYHTAISKSGCKGMAQLSPATMKSIYKEVNMEYSENQIWHDIHNIMAGFYYLDKALQIDSINAAKYYIGGPKWKKAKDLVEYIDGYDVQIKHEKELLSAVYRGIK